MSKHTAGMWDSGVSIPLTARACEDNGFSIVFINRDDTTEAEANAKLISAAPELFALAKESADMLERIMANDDWGAIEEHIQDLRAAIAKATGGES